MGCTMLTVRSKSRVRKFHGTKVLGLFAPRERMFHGTKVPRERKFSLWSFHSRERKRRGTKRPVTTRSPAPPRPAYLPTPCARQCHLPGWPDGVDCSKKRVSKLGCVSSSALQKWPKASGPLVDRRSTNRSARNRASDDDSISRSSA